MKNLLCLFLAAYLTAVVCAAQDAPVVEANANACELNSLHLDNINVQLSNDPTANLLVKSSRSKNESRATGERRLAYVRNFLDKHKRFDIGRVEFVNADETVAVGENPKIEFYVRYPGETEGKLRLTTRSLVNKTPCLDCCNAEFEPKNIRAKPKSKKPATKPRKRRRK